MRQMLGPYAVALQVTPRIAIAPLIIAWAGFGYSSKIWIAAIIAFFPVYVNALTGILTVDEEARGRCSARSERAGCRRSPA